MTAPEEQEAQRARIREFAELIRRPPPAGAGRDVASLCDALRRWTEYASAYAQALQGYAETEVAQELLDALLATVERLRAEWLAFSRAQGEPEKLTLDDFHESCRCKTCGSLLFPVRDNQGNTQRTLCGRCDHDELEGLIERGELR